MVQRRKSCILGLAAALFLAVFDQLTKYWAVLYLKNGHSISLIPGIFQLHYLENRGAAFGLLQGQKLWFIFITLAALFLLIWVYVRTPMEKRYRWLRMVLAVLAAGAAGNFIDRIRLSYVIDFFYFEWIDFPIFNVADVYVSVGIAVLIGLVLFYYKEEELEGLIFPKKK